MLGYPKIKVLHGGFEAWAAAGLPVTTDVPTPVKASFSVVPEAGDILIDAKTMLAASASPASRCSTFATSTSGSAKALRHTARISAPARAGFPARCGWNGTA